MKQKPKYLLKYGMKEVEANEVEDLLKLTKNITLPWEVFRVYKSAMNGLERSKSVLTIKMIEDAKRMDERGYHRDVIAKRIGVGRFMVDKIIGVNASI